MQKVFVSEAAKRKIKWSEGGRILVCDMEDNVLSIEKYTKGSLANIIGFLEKKTTEKKPSPKFNAVARNLLAGVNGFDMIQDGDDFLCIVNNKTPKVKLRRTWHKTVESLKMYVPVEFKMKENARYDVIFEDDGTIYFQFREEISAENINASYNTPVLNSYAV
ncbi:hypothetical protein PHIM7_321 [Sinorhizobium phage phiM7]|uniref:Uncharacterized protein n=3 Tax=Emdodecavirus TaxID=1980937 RepID=S5MVW6_9CAUD|nr:hypothetical protein AB690_gp193 [Sinorhizobium phage phiM12]YP_009212566.1 hypothetical protein AVT40_gp207 [Sinorhizobium phage phiN3]YP_009601446.1 hypothetical protein FDH46_gp157 [Sinorhizobium phage phiM7]AKF13226.1 hypothetical protein PHIM19_321 [Sinorhizobium phage phiM19]AGR48042.1 hypothetical protein SmphiM12_410 [Sinorhizobium phage phiM12]AKF12866.1 hypothetical protein PHIM7_321 [Sinorhizobium phage phiM7]AKF13589.1 hypothetical protein PHIN3_326 [Sinorhizobium phage phiN3]